MNVDEVLKELARELKTRESVYPKWIQEGAMASKTADRRIEAIKTAITLIEKAYPQEEAQQAAQGSLFSLGEK